MYAFAIWDSRTRKLVMIRDRMGIMPVYFYRYGSGKIQKFIIREAWGNGEYGENELPTITDGAAG